MGNGELRVGNPVCKRCKANHPVGYDCTPQPIDLSRVVPMPNDKPISSAMIEAGVKSMEETGFYGYDLRDQLREAYTAMHNARDDYDARFEAADPSELGQCGKCGADYLGECPQHPSHQASTPLDDERTEAEELAIIAEAFPPKPKCGSAEPFAEYERAMREEVIPKIEADLKAQGRAAHYLRLGIPDPASKSASPLDDEVVAALRDLESAASTTARYGATTGPQWSRLAGSLIKARAALKSLQSAR